MAHGHVQLEMTVQHFVYSVPELFPVLAIGGALSWILGPRIYPFIFSFEYVLTF